MLCDVSPHFGYFVNFLIVKEKNLPLVRDILEILVFSSLLRRGKYLGAALGSSEFINSYVNGKVRDWSDELSKLSEISLTQPHSAYSIL